MFRIPPPYLWTPLSPQRVKGCSPLTIPKMRSKPKNASRFAKRIFLCFSHLRLRRRFYLSAELHALRGRNTSCEAANRRNEKKALSAATSFFPFRQPLRDYQGRAALDSCLPRLESSGCFSGSLLARKRELSPNATALRPRATGAQACLTARHTLHTPPSSQSPAGYRNAPARGCTGRQASSLRRRGHSPSRR